MTQMLILKSYKIQTWKEADSAEEVEVVDKFGRKEEEESQAKKVEAGEHEASGISHWNGFSISN
jgi:hypothetical protein